MKVSKPGRYFAWRKRKPVLNVAPIIIAISTTDTASPPHFHTNLSLAAKAIATGRNDHL